MITKSIQLLKKNSVIILFYAIYLIVSLLVFFILYPKNFSQFAITNTNDFNYNAFDFAAFGIAILRILIAVILMYIGSLIFFSGFGNMLSEAVLKDKTSSASFFPGLKKYFVRVLLASLLLIAFCMGFSIVLSILFMPLSILFVGNLKVMMVISFIPAVIMIFAIPFITLWFPTIFIDDTGVMNSLKNGAKAGVKNYWKLLLILLVIYIPSVVYTIFSFDSMTKGNIFTPGYYILIILSSIISMIILPMIFIIYKDSNPVHKIEESNQINNIIE